MDGVVRGLNERVLGREGEIVGANRKRFEINVHLFADDTALVSDSKERLC